MMTKAEPLVQRARTKIVATVGPACAQPQQLRKLIEAGVDVFRLNMAHGDRDEHEATIVSIRQLSTELRPIGILVDLAGPKIRLGELAEDPFHCARDATLRFVRDTTTKDASRLVSNYDRLVDELDVGDQVMLADGTVSLIVTERDSDQVICRVVNEGVIRSRQGINLPGAKLSLPPLTDHDLDCARWAAGQPIDFVSLSFVRKPGDVQALRELLQKNACTAGVIAKIEKREALDGLEEIVDAADGVMVARGDLGVEIEVARIANVQKRIVALCNQKRKCVIVATQMLDSMQRSRRPTRAEVTDVANAILDGADACMLSGETAIGQYPVETVETMNQIMIATETLMSDRLPSDGRHKSEILHPITDSVVHGAVEIARRMDAKLIVIVTQSGATAMAKSNHRDMIPCVAVSDSQTTLRQTCLMWGITPLPDAPSLDAAKLRQFIDQWGRDDGLLSSGDRVVVVTGSGLVSGAHNLVEVHEVE